MRCNDYNDIEAGKGVLTRTGPNQKGLVLAFGPRTVTRLWDLEIRDWKFGL